MGMFEVSKHAYEVNDSKIEKGEKCSSKEYSVFVKREVCEDISLTNARELVEDFHVKSANQILELHKDYISFEGKERLEKGADSLNVFPYRDGMENIGSFLYHDGKTAINICAIDIGQIERTTQHETNHLASYNVEISQKEELNPSKSHISRVSGIHAMEYIEDSDKGIVEFRDRNRGFNEGITQMYTNRQLEMRTPGKGIEAARQNGYMFATELSEQVEQIVSPEVIAKAYYGGKLDLLKMHIDTLGGEGSFERLSHDMDKVTYSANYVERLLAMRDAQELLAEMSEGEAA